MGHQICYRIFSEILELPEIGRYRTYGLSVCPRQQPNGETQNREFVRVSDVSTSEEKVRRLADILDFPENSWKRKWIMIWKSLKY